MPSLSKRNQKGMQVKLGRLGCLRSFLMCIWVEPCSCRSEVCDRSHVCCGCFLSNRLAWLHIVGIVSGSAGYCFSLLGVLWNVGHPYPLSLRPIRAPYGIGEYRKMCAVVPHILARGSAARPRCIPLGYGWIRALSPEPASKHVGV